MNYLASNLSALESVLGPGVRLPDDEGRARVETVGGVPVLTLAAAPGVPAVATNSRRNPAAEALKLLDSALAGRPRPDVVVCLGIGLGFVLDAVEQRCPAARILALEPEPACLRPLLVNRDLGPLLSSGRLLLLWGPEYRGAESGWRFVDGNDEARTIVVHPALARQNPKAFEAARAAVDQMVFGAQANAEARKKFSGRYLRNTLANLPVITRSANVAALFAAFRRTPAIIASAGPSLDRSIPELRAHASGTLLIAVDTAARPLLSAGVAPHLVVGVDPGELNGLHLRDLPDPGRSWLVAEGSLDPPAFEQFADRTFVFQVSNHHPWPWLAGQGLDRGILKAWGSVATSAFDLAIRAGCDPIVFVGQDLAYTDGQTYCRGTIYEDDWARAVAGGTSLPDVWAADLARRELLLEPDLRGIPTPFTPTLRAFRNWLVEQAWLHRDRRFVNASGAGFLVGPGIQQATLTDALCAADRSRHGAIERRLVRLHTASRAEQEVQPQRLAAALEDALGDVTGAAWCRFAEPTVGPEQVAETVRKAAGRLLAEPRPQVELRNEGPGTSLLAPERAAVIRSVRRCEPIPGWVAPRPGEETGNDAAAAYEAYRLLTELLRMPELVGAASPPAGTPHQPVPSLAFRWNEKAMPLVRRLEHAVAEAALRYARSGRTDAGAVAVEPHAGGSRQTARPAAPDSVVRHELAALFTAVLEPLREWGGGHDLADLLEQSAATHAARRPGPASYLSPLLEEVANRRTRPRTAASQEPRMPGGGHRAVSQAKDGSLMYAPRIHQSYPGFDEVVDHYLEDRSLFVIGCARSGTTILLDMLNSLPDVFLFGEANFALNFYMEDFPEWYNLKHHRHGMPRQKGTHAPYLGPRRLHDYLRLISDHYRFVGEKIAFGPHGHYNGASHQENVLQFNERFFFRAPHVFVFRHPRAVLRSMAVKFTDKDAVELARCWLLTADLFADMASVFPAVHLVMFESLPDALDGLGPAIGLDLSGAKAMFGQPGGGAGVARLDHLEPLVDILEPLYHTIAGIAASASLAEAGPSGIAELRDRLAAAARQLDGQPCGSGR